MHRRIERRLKFATILLVLSGYLGLITTFSYGPDVLIVPLAAIALMPVGEWFDRRFPAYRRFTSAVILAFIALSFIVVRRFSLLDGVIALVMFIQVYSLLHQKTLRNYVHLFLMSFFLLLAATVMTPRPDIAAVFLLFLVSLTWGMSLLEMFAASNSVSGASQGAPQWRSTAGDIVPARNVRLFDVRLSSLVTLTAVGVLAVAAILFALGPRTEAGVFGAARTQEAAPVGLSSEVDITGSSVLRMTGAAVMRVQFPQEEGGQYLGPMLWRVTALDAYTGGGWQHRGVVTPGYSTDERKRFKSDSRFSTREGLERPRGKWGEVEWPQVYYEIYLDRPPETAVPLLQLVTQVIPGEENPSVQFRWDYANDFSVLVQSRGESGIALNATSDIMEPTLEPMRQVVADPAQSMSRQDFEQLTYQDLLPETRALVDQLTQNEPTVYDKILSLEQYLSGTEFEYSRVIPVLPSKNPIDFFILNERRGHCQLFASALALMVRSQGLPARVVSGYRGGNWDPGDRSYTVTEDMAHLWVEVYFGGVGWIAFDPSPMDRETDEFSFSTISRAYSRYVLKARLLWLRNIVAFQQRGRGDAWRDFSARIFRSGGETWDRIQSRDHRVSIGGGTQQVLIGTAVFGAVCALIWMAFRGRTRTRTRRELLNGDQRRAVRFYARIRRKLGRLGVSCEGCTAEEILQSVENLPLNDGAAVAAGLALYNEVRFGRRPLSAGELGAWNRRIARLDIAPPADSRVTAG